MIRYLALFVAFLCLPSCSDDDRWVPEVASIQRTDVFITNFSAESIFEVYLRLEGSPEWGANWLTHHISGGNLYAYVGEVLSGRYDIRMVGEFRTQEALGMDLVGDYISISFAAPETKASAGSRVVLNQK